jgi:hypothetical protein
MSASPRFGFASSNDWPMLFEARLLFVYRSEASPENRLPPDFVTVLTMPPVKPPYSAGAPRPPICISSIRYWLKNVQAEPPSGSRVSTPSSSSALP